MDSSRSAVFETQPIDVLWELGPSSMASDLVLRSPPALPVTLSFLGLSAFAEALSLFICRWGQRAGGLYALPLAF